MSRMDMLDRSDTRIQQHTQAMKRLVNSFENSDIGVRTFTIEMNRQLRDLFKLLGEMKKE